MMAMVLDAASISELIAAIISLSVPMAFAALGEVISERAGVINLGTEGVMLVGAISAFYVSFFFGSNLVGVLLGAAGGALLGLVMAFISISLPNVSAAIRPLACRGHRVLREDVRLERSRREPPE